MPRRRTKGHVPSYPPTEHPTLYRLLMTLEDGQGGFHWPGQIITASQVHPESLLILLERGALMFHIDPAALAALPEE
jgi:hypothetical protein